MKKLLFICLFLNIGISQTPYDSLFTDATFISMDNREITLNQLKGKVVVFDFWETWCGPCIMGFKKLKKLRKKYPEDFIVVAVNQLKGDTKEKAQDFVSANNYDFIFVYDNGMSDQLNISTLPFKVYFDPQGNFISKSTGFAIYPTEYSKAKKLINEYKLKD